MRWKIVATVTMILLVYRVRAITSYADLSPDTVFHMDYRESVETPNWARDTPVTPFRISAWNQCPNGTNYVLRNKPSPVGQDANFPRDLVLGCCPVNQTGCTIPGVDRLIGCCPRGQQCAYRPGNRAYLGGVRFMGCVDEPSQDCNGKRCPVGYLCCPQQDQREAQCVPHAGDPNDYDAVCADKYRAPPQLIAPSRKVRDFTYYSGPKRLVNLTTIEVQGVNVSASLVMDPPQYVCENTFMRCKIGDFCSQHEMIVNTTTNATATRFSYCCPPQHTTCHGFASEKTGILPPTDSGGFIGCADDTAGEICCGNSICPAGHKCCSSIDPFSGTLVDKQCCPDELECCYGDPGQGSVGLPLITSFTRLPRSYCGMTVFNNTCAMDRWAPSQYFTLNRGLRLGHFPVHDP